MVRVAIRSKANLEAHDVGDQTRADELVHF